MDTIQKKKIAVGIISLIGFATTIKLAMIYYNANFNPYALSSFCSINEFIDCDGIARTTESQFLGIPLAYWGMFYYLFVLLLLFGKKLTEINLFKFMEVFKNPLSYIAILGIFSFLVSMTLLGLSLFEIKKLCVLCAFTYVLNLIIGLISISWKEGGVVKDFKNCINDFLDAIKNKAYLAAFVVVVLLAGAGLAHTATTNKFAPQVKRQKEFGEFVYAKTNKYAVSGNILGDEDAKVIVYAYTDYNCPFCSGFDIMLHKLAKELSGFKVVHVNLPLDIECNKHLKHPFHEGSCRMAKYALAAEKQGKFWDIDSKFFELKPTSDDAILEIAKDLGLDVDKLKEDANSKEVAKELEEHIDNAYAQGINGTPAFVINQKMEMGIKPYPEMKKILEDAGAKPRRRF